MLNFFILISFLNIIYNKSIDLKKLFFKTKKVCETCNPGYTLATNEPKCSRYILTFPVTLLVLRINICNLRFEYFSIVGRSCLEWNYNTVFRSIQIWKMGAAFGFKIRNIFFLQIKPFGVGSTRMIALTTFCIIFRTVSMENSRPKK